VLGVVLSELVSRSPVALPAGRLVTPEDGGPPAYWLSDAVVDPGLVARLRAAATGSGLQPLLLRGMHAPDGAEPWAVRDVYPAVMSSADDHYPGPLLASWWRDYDDSGEPWPGMAVPGSSGADPDQVADALTADLLTRPCRLGLVAAASGAHALPVLGWSGPVNYTNDTGEIAAVVRGWQHRFGARVVQIGMSTLVLAVAAPPRTVEHARQVAAEHYAFCPDLVDQGCGHLHDYAETLAGAATWRFWWD
jgi:hypothetical protein